MQLCACSCVEVRVVRGSSSEGEGLRDLLCGAEWLAVLSRLHSATGAVKEAADADAAGRERSAADKRIRELEDKVGGVQWARREGRFQQALRTKLVAAAQRNTPEEFGVLQAAHRESWSCGGGLTRPCSARRAGA